MANVSDGASEDSFVRALRKRTDAAILERKRQRAEFVASLHAVEIDTQNGIERLKEQLECESSKGRRCVRVLLWSLFPELKRQYDLACVHGTLDEYRVWSEGHLVVVFAQIVNGLGFTLCEHNNFNGQHDTCSKNVHMVAPNRYIADGHSLEFKW